MDAATQFADSSLDWVFIDAFHGFHALTADILAWYPKIKPGGLVSGHDDGHLGINPALRRLFPHVCAWDTIWYTRSDGNPLKPRLLPSLEYALRLTLRGEKI